MMWQVRVSVWLGCALLLVGLALLPSAQANGDFELGPETRARNIAEPFNYFSNPWTAIGLKDYVDGTRISPTGEFLLAGGLTCQTLIGQAMVPLNPKVKPTLRKGYLPIVTYDFVINEQVRYTIETCACPMPSGNHGDYDWPAEDENFLNMVRITVRFRTVMRTMLRKTKTSSTWYASPSGT